MNTSHPLSSARRLAAWFALGAAALVLTACGGSDGDGAPSFRAIELNIAHINDHHSQLEPIAAQELTLDGVATQVELGGFARQTAVFKALANTPT